jgi:DNA-binding SARP family transcriptional activator
MTDRGTDPIVVGLLGPVVLTVDGQPRPVGGLRRRAVLAVLAASSGAAVPVQRLHDAVWSDTGNPAAKTTLQVHVHGLRQVLAPHGDAVQHTPAGYRLAAATDVGQAEDALRRARAAERAGDAAGAARGFRAALALWRGEFCADLADFGYLHAARGLYDKLRLDALEAALGAELRIGTPGLVGELEALVERHPLRERMWGQLMVALYRDGRQADALHAYQRARAVLADEAGLDPGAALRRLESAILGQAGTAELLRFGAPDAAAPGRAALTWLDADGLPRRRELPGSGELVIGRAGSADIALTWDAAVSRRHAAVAAHGGAVVVRDLGSRNGTFHNGQPVPGGAGGVPLRARDLLRCGDTLLAVNGPPERRAGSDSDPTAEPDGWAHH